MKKIYSICIILVFTIVLTACKGKDDTFTLTLMVNGEAYEVFENLSKGEVISLDNLTPLEGYMFTGWKNEDDFYMNTYTVYEDTTLVANLEDVSVVFEFEDSENDYYGGIINDYTGAGGYLQVPEFIDGVQVMTIWTDAFMNSNVYEIVLPSEAFIMEEAFVGSNKLTKIGFEGDYYKEYEEIIRCPIFGNCDVCDRYKLRIRKIGSNNWKKY